MTNITEINLYHIVHTDRLSSIVQSDKLLCDSEVQNLQFSGTTIGMNEIKNRRMGIPLNSYPDLHVGDCVPFYFCPRSIMLYMFYMNNNPKISYNGGQDPIVHLVFNMITVIEWAKQQKQRWVFTDSNAGSYHFNDFCTIGDLNKLDWGAINAKSWSNCKEKKQAEFLVENFLPWKLVNEVAVYSDLWNNKVQQILANVTHRPNITIKPEWYY